MKRAQRRPAAPYPAAWQRLGAARVGGSRLGFSSFAKPQASQPAFPVGAATTGHPLADPAISSALKQRSDEIQEAFSAIEPSL